MPAMNDVTNPTTPITIDVYADVVCPGGSTVYDAPEEGNMATVRAGDRQVLLVVDVQVGVVQGTWEGERVVGNVVRAVERSRDAAVPVVWVQHEDDELPRGTDAWQWAPQLAPADGEAVVHKRYNSAFEDTELEVVLASLGATHVVLTGVATNWCVRATAYGALDRGYDLTLVKDAHTTEPIEFSDGRVVAAEDIVRELNVAMSWLTFPGRSTRTVAVEGLTFGDAEPPATPQHRS